MEFDLETKLLPPGKKIVDKWSKRYKPKRTLKKKKPTQRSPTPCSR